MTFTKGPCAVKTHGNVTELWSNDMQLGDTGIYQAQICLWHATRGEGV